MKIWEIGTINDPCNYWRFIGEEDRKYDLYEWDGSWIDNYEKMEAIVNKGQIRFGIQYYLDVFLSGSKEISDLKNYMNLQTVQFLPFTCEENKGEDLFIWNVLRVDEVLDEGKCEFNYFSSGRVMDITKFAFNEEVIKDLSIFKIKYEPASVYVSDEFKNAYENLTLKGLSFRCIWDSEKSDIEEKNNNLNINETNNDQNKFIKHIESHIGKVVNVYREPLNIDMMFDVLIVENDNYKALVTNGLRNFDMNVPVQLNEFKNIELMMFLDKSFDISEEGLKKEENRWIMDLIKSISTYPIKYNSYINWGHTLSNGPDDRAYCSSVGYSSVFIYPPTVQEDVSFYCYNDGKSNNYIYNIMPIYKEEKEFIISNSGDDFFDLMADEDINQIVTLNRKNLIG